MCEKYDDSLVECEAVAVSPLLSDDLLQLLEAWPSLCDEAHSIARAKGWWDDRRELPELVALIHTEIAEYAACTGARCDKDGLDLLDYEEELADTAIRLADMMGHYGMCVDVEALGSPYELCGVNELLLHNSAAAITEAYRLDGCASDRMAAVCTILLESLLYVSQSDNCTLLWCMRQKMAYNRTRPYRHGGKKA